MSTDYLTDASTGFSVPITLLPAYSPTHPPHCNQLPMQNNTYDCGVFVIKYAEQVLDKRPKIGASDIKNKLEAYFNENVFESQKDINEKVNI